MLWSDGGQGQQGGDSWVRGGGGMKSMSRAAVETSGTSERIWEEGQKGKKEIQRQSEQRDLH